MDLQEQISIIKKRIAFDIADTDVVIDIFNNTLSIALSFCGIGALENSKNKNTILSIVQTTVCGIYLQRGNEGQIGYTTGSQSATYEKHIETMETVLNRSRCRVWS
ncbi:MAG: hypothetical protein RR623_04010 [Bacilli bacterium]